jgi:O-antigen/teichoic acid export membrane protein
VGLYLAIGAIAILLGGALVVPFTSMHGIDASLVPMTRIAFALMVVYVSVGFIGLLPEAILFAHHNFVVRNAVRIIGVVVRLVLTIGVLAVTPSLIALAAVQIACLAFDFAVCYVVIRRRHAGVRFSVGDFDWRVLRRIVSFSMYVLLLHAGARLSFETDAIVIGGFIGVSLIPFYAVANSLIVYLMDFVGSISAVVTPTATTLATMGRFDELREMFLRWSKIALSLSLLAGVYLMVLGPLFIGRWIDASFEAPSGIVLQILMASSLVFMPARGVSLPVLIGLGKPRTAAFAFLAAGILNLVLSIALSGPFGLAGVAWGTAIPNVLFAAVVWLAACRALDVRPWTYVRYVVLRPVVGALPSLGVVAWCRYVLAVGDMLGLVAAGIATAATFGLTAVLFIYRDDPYVDIRSPLVRCRAWKWSRAA